MIYSIVLAAFALRLHTILFTPVYIDESDTIRLYVSLSIVEAFTQFHSNNHPVASLLARIFAGETLNLFLLRWPMVLIGTLTMALIFRLGMLLFNYRIAIVAMILLCFSPMHVYLSVSVRGYGGLICCVIFSLYFLLQAFYRGNWYYWAGFLLVSVISPFFHLFGAMAMLLGQLGLGWIACIYGYFFAPNPNQKIKFKSDAVFLSIITLVLIGLYLPLIYYQTTTILSEGGYQTIFDRWRDGQLLIDEDIKPILRLFWWFSPSRFGLYTYLAFGIIGLGQLWRQSKTFMLLIVTWFIGPFVAAHVALQLLGNNFYIYERFFVYLIPLFLLVVAQGIVVVLTNIQTIFPYHSLLRWGVIAFIIFGMFWIQINALSQYLSVIMKVNWYEVAETVKKYDLTSADIVVCEENSGYFDPDDDYVYCQWALESLVPGLDKDHLVSGIHLLANYDYLDNKRSTLLHPGRILLVYWGGDRFFPYRAIDDVLLAEYSIEHNLSDLSVILSEKGDSFIENLQLSMMSLVNINDSSSVDLARYYRSMAEIEALQGQASQARVYYSKSWSQIEQAGNMYPEIFLEKTASYINRIPDSDLPPATAVLVNFKLDDSICLAGVDIVPRTFKSGETINLSFYWQSIGFAQQNHKFYLQFNDLPHINFEPFDNTYPTPWWWPGQRLVDRKELTIPIDFPAGNYKMMLGSPQANVNLNILEMRYTR